MNNELFEPFIYNKIFIKYNYSFYNKPYCATTCTIYQIYNNIMPRTNKHFLI